MTRVPPALRRQVLERATPTPNLTRQAKRVAASLRRGLLQEARRRGLKVEPRLVGSIAKDTHLAEHLDVDMFVLFPATTPRTVLETEGVALGRSVLPEAVLKYAEHPYVHGVLDGLPVDVVPAYKLRDASGKISAVDRTPFHTSYVRRHATARQRAEIRLLKRFLRGVQCYGAETSTGGVSGYLAELLVLKHKTFPRTIDAIASWEPPVELSLTGRPSVLGGPLVFVDPVDASRNAAAAVTSATFERLRRAARAFRRKPRIEFFFARPPKPLPATALKALLAQTPTLGLEAPVPTGRPETLRPQGQRLLAKLQRVLAEEGFRSVDHDTFVTSDRILLLLRHDPPRLSATYEHRGPLASEAEHAERFQTKWAKRHDVLKGPRVVGHRWTVTVRRKERTPVEILRPRLAWLLDGFGYDPRAVGAGRLLEGPALAADPARQLALTLFLRRLDPWNY